MFEALAVLVLRDDGCFLSLVMYATAKWANSLSDKMGLCRNAVGKC